MSENWNLYTPYRPPFTGMLRAMPRAESRKCYEVWFEARSVRWAELQTLSGIQLDGSDESLHALNDWFLAGVERSSTDPDRLANRWYAVINDVGVVIGDVLINRYPGLQWDFWLRGGKSDLAYQAQVVTGFSRVPNPRYYVAPHEALAGYGFRASAGMSVDPEQFLAMVRHAASLA